MPRTESLKVIQVKLLVSFSFFSFFLFFLLPLSLSFSQKRRWGYSIHFHKERKGMNFWTNDWFSLSLFLDFSASTSFFLLSFLHLKCIQFSQCFFCENFVLPHRSPTFYSSPSFTSFFFSISFPTRFHVLFQFYIPSLELLSVFFPSFPFLPFLSFSSFPLLFLANFTFLPFHRSFFSCSCIPRTISSYLEEKMMMTFLVSPRKETATFSLSFFLSPSLSFLFLSFFLSFLSLPLPSISYLFSVLMLKPHHFHPSDRLSNIWMVVSQWMTPPFQI